MEHLTDKQIGRLLAEAEPPEQVAAANAHLAECPVCRQALQSSLPQAIQSLPGLLTTDATSGACLDTDLIARYVYGETDEWENETIEMHSEDCSFCRDDIVALREVRESMERETAQPRAAATVAAAPTEAAAAAVPVSLPWWKQLQAHLSSQATAWSALSPRIALAAVFLVCAVLLGQEILHRHQENGLRQRLNLLTTQIADAGAVRHELEAAQQAAALARLQSETLAAHSQLTFAAAVPAQLRALTTSEGTALGSEQVGVPFPLEYPVGRIVEAETPTFRWRPMSGATAYVVELNDRSSRAETLAPSPRLSLTAWTCPVALHRDHAYSWQVIAFQGAKEIARSYRPPRTPALFQILDGATVAQLKRSSGDALSQGILYAQAGMPEEAEARFHDYAQTAPHSSVLENLMRNVQALKKRRAEIQHTMP